MEEEGKIKYLHAMTNGRFTFTLWDDQTGADIGTYVIFSNPVAVQVVLAAFQRNATVLVHVEEQNGTAIVVFGDRLVSGVRTA